MRFRLVWVLALFLVPAGPVAAETGDPECMTRVTITPAGDHLDVTWSLSQPVTQFSFPGWAVAAQQRLDEWALEDAGFSFNGVELDREDGTAFKEFSMSVGEATAFHDRYYVPVVRIGETGWFIRAAAFGDKACQTSLHLEGVDPEDIVRGVDGQAAEGAAIPLTVKGFIYVGPAAYIDADASLTVIAGPDFPDWLREVFAGSTETVTATLARRFDVAMPAPPTQVLTYKADWNGQSWKGSSLGLFLPIYLRGMELRPDDNAFIDQMRSLAMHEAVHIWIGQLFESAENSEQAWLHEGAAEYISLRPWATPDQMRGRMETKINNCQRVLVNKSILETAHASRGRAPYECGPLVQLIAEAASLKAGGGDILDIWKRVFERTGEEGVFNTAMFRAVATEAGGEDFTAPMAQLEAGMDAGEWEAFLTGLSSLGIEIDMLGEESSFPNERSLAQLALGAIQQDYCNNQISLYGYEDHYWTDISDRCGGAMPGDPKLRTLNGIDVIEAPGAAYGEMRRACAAGDSIVLGRLDGELLDPLACGPRMSQLTGMVQVVALPALPEL